MTANVESLLKKKKKVKRLPPLGPIRDFPCRPCVTRAVKAPGHECASQNSTLGTEE